jgi:UDP-GlcNAc:undecaprenyl-phosphate GlcNAc-1-phosphate transferase
VTTVAVGAGGRRSADRPPSFGRLAAAALVSAASARFVTRELTDRVGDQPGWRRRNHRGADTSLTAGPGFALGTVAGTVTGGVGRVAAVAAAAAAVGRYDDVRGRGSSVKGLRGHLGALRHGAISSGAVKVAGLAATGLAAVWPGRPADRLPDGALIAGAANLVNLLDLRPGRALKAVGLLAGPLLLGGRPAGRISAAAAAGAAAGLLPADLGERVMLGDCGANAAGAVLGLAAVRGLPPAARRIALAAVVLLTLASERVSFTEVIDRVGPLRALDRCGRRPAPAR